jgi:hypothetical protein
MGVEVGYKVEQRIPVGVTGAGYLMVSSISRGSAVWKSFRSRARARNDAPIFWLNIHSLHSQDAVVPAGTLQYFAPYLHPSQVSTRFKMERELDYIIAGHLLDECVFFQEILNLYTIYP